MVTKELMTPLGVGATYYTDDQIVQLYRAAIRAQRSNQGMVDENSDQFVAGFWDIVGYSLGIVVLGEGFYGFWLICAFLLFLGGFMPIGPLSLIYWVSRTARTRIVMPKNIDPASMHVLCTVAESLARPAIEAAKEHEAELRQKQRRVLLLIEQTEGMERQLLARRARAGELEDAYNSRIRASIEESSYLWEMAVELEKEASQTAHDIAEMENYLTHLGELEKATEQLSKVKRETQRLVASSKGVADVPAAVEEAKRNLRGIALSVKAYEAAVSEVQTGRQ